MKELKKETSAGGWFAAPAPTRYADWRRRPCPLCSPIYQRINSRPCFRTPFPGPRPAEFNFRVRPSPGSSFLLDRAGNRGFPKCCWDLLPIFAAPAELV
jgi:hypothetical protein